MEFRRLGHSGLKVSLIGLGGDALGRGMANVDERTAISIVNHALELGINYIDTADVYCMGDSEQFIGKALKGKRSQAIIATKCGMPAGEGPNDAGLSRHHIMTAIDASLKRLDTDYVDLYQTHLHDPSTPMEETLQALDDLVHAGKVRYIGCSNISAWQLCEALWISKVNNLQSFVTAQSRYNIIERHIELDMVPCCRAYEVGVIPWYPLLGGLLTGKYRRDEPPMAGTRMGDDENEARRKLYAEI